MKKKDDFANQIIQCHDKIMLMEFTGIDANYKQVSKALFIVKGTKPDKKTLGFKKLLDVSLLAEKR